VARSVTSFLNFVTALFVLLVLSAPLRGGTLTGAVVLALAVFGANRALVWPLSLTTSQRRALKVRARKALKAGR
jgi:hypothetical protein